MTTSAAGAPDDAALLAVLRLCVAATVRAGNAANPPLTPTQVRVLNLLAESAGASLGEVAAELGASPPSTSRLVTRLARDGLVERHAGAGHHLDLRLTAAGTRAVRLLNRRRVRELRRALDALPAADRAAAATGLAALTRDPRTAEVAW